ncbi:PAAR domain-containing protein [Imbroritus primus]|uniref:PAAR domain-containing protein n=1 Tax=Imbroritus primus TaxID=3058603 RepID=A0ACD3SQB2_9BURK|nr:PAAR domain-containing protein [Burkholderiaceae bacterium PBA]
MTTYRHLLRSGDSTSTNGILIASGDLIRGDVRVAVEGDYATCPACDGGGVVFNTCTPTFRQRGRRVLVHGAYVNCRCEAKPIVLASRGSLGIEVQIPEIEIPYGQHPSDMELMAAMQALCVEARRVREWRTAGYPGAAGNDALDRRLDADLGAACRSARDGLMRIKAVTLEIGEQT